MDPTLHHLPERSTSPESVHASAQLGSTHGAPEISEHVTRLINAAGFLDLDDFMAVAAMRVRVDRRELLRHRWLGDHSASANFGHNGLP
jgi:hypothetical protein